MTTTAIQRRRGVSYARATGVLASFLLLALGPVNAQRSGAQRPAAPAGPVPQVSLAGIRIVGPGGGENGSELRAFNESPGTTLAFFVKAPAGTGIVDIDDDASKLDAVTDDKGQAMLEEGRFGPFPKVSDDGSTGMFEIEVRTRPSAGAQSVTAQGSAAVTMATGTKPQKIANLRLEVGKTGKLGTATITVKEVSAGGEDSTSLTIGLSRSVMKTIREVKFYDAKAAAIESSGTGSGYMNEDAEMRFDVKTKEKVVTLEFHVWQNIRVVKVPFNVKAGLSLDR